MKKITLGLLFCFLLQACTGLIGKGDKLFEQGKYREAAQYYERALKRKPDNPEAQLGLSRARHKIIDEDLIAVRMLRLSSNMVGAAEKLEQVLRNQLAWNIKVDGAIAATQSEETRFAIKWLLLEAKKLSNSPFPDKFRWFQFSYKQLIANGQLQNKLEAYNSTISANGKKQCRNFAKIAGGSQFYLSDFAKKYCSIWGQKIALRVDKLDRSRYSAVSIRYDVDHRTRESQRRNLNAYLDQLKEMFRTTPWYSERGHSPLIVRAEGRLNFSRRSERVTKLANYTVKKSIKSYNDQGKEVTKTVDRPRVHKYDSRVYTEEAHLNLSYRSEINKLPIVSSVRNKKTHNTEEHNERFSAAKISPKKPKFMNESKFFGENFKQLNIKFIDELKQKWESAYCDERISKSEGENSLRCAKVRAEDTLVNTWFAQKFGLDYTQMQLLYGL